MTTAPETRPPEPADAAVATTAVGPARGLLRRIVSTYLWAILVADTTLCYLAGWLLVPFLGMRQAFQIVVRWWALIAIRLGFFRCRIEGREHLRGGAVVAANHASVLDICVLAAVIPPPYYFVARNEVRRLPFVGSVLYRGGHILIERSGGGNDAAMERAVEICRQGSRVIFFPEGTRSRDGRVGPFRGGAFVVAHRAGRPVVPVAIAGTRDALPPGTSLLLPTRVAVSMLPPRPVDSEALQTERIKREVRDAVAARVGEIGAGTGPRI